MSKQRTHELLAHTDRGAFVVYRGPLETVMDVEEDLAIRLLDPNGGDVLVRLPAREITALVVNEIASRE